MQKKVQVIARDAIEPLHRVDVAGTVHELGTVKSFARVPALGEFIPPHTGVAMSWVHLAGGQELGAHRHEERGMILVCEGTGEVFGDIERPLAAGDTVLVGSGCLHGFRGTGEGFWGLSMQFNGSAFYDQPHTPRIAFEASSARPVERLLARNDARILGFAQSQLVALVNDPDELDVTTRERLLDCLQTWSDFFQRLLHLRAALTVDHDQQRVAVQHLTEELGHNDNLRKQRGGAFVACNDAVLQAAMHWFKHAMMVGSDYERTLLMHLVLEASGEIFHEQASAAFGDMPHFREHGEDDGDHAAYGVDLLRRAPAASLPGLETTLETGWDMMILLCDRMAQLATPDRRGVAA
jgi:quercetin dioxygenase-like cupin family protein